MASLTPDELRSRAWRLVRAYVAATLGELPAHKRRRFEHIAENVAPLGALVDYELARRGLTYAGASQLIARSLGEGYAEPIINASTLCYLKKPERRNWNMRLHNLQQIAIGFDWDSNWLRAVNCEAVELPDEIDIETVRRLAAIRQPEVAQIVDIMAALPADGRSLLSRFAHNLAEQYRCGVVNHNHANVAT